MTARALKEALEKAEAWPEEAQQELAAIVREIDAELRGGIYHATPEELAGIDRGLKAAMEGRFATEAQVEAVLSEKRLAGRLSILRTRFAISTRFSLSSTRIIRPFLRRSDCGYKPSRHDRSMAAEGGSTLRSDQAFESFRLSSPLSVSENAVELLDPESETRASRL